ncbi:ectoine synthase [Gimesia chilikensis]|uniref:L-ectoine synthase n=1 Tax=Gimesia chilikensis TaxID=2605989 RepID=A0A517WI47_9PLAN|nr:ectoine synthase [Gimesia chilikensis]QDU04931.1 L-ectoine synthase [Gimesia chilikensis]
MLVRQLSEIIDTDRDIKAETWNSRRLLLAGDKMGFSLHDTLIHPGTETEIWYQNHLEAVYCIEGEGEIELIPDGPTYPISPGMMYALDQNDRHLLRAKSQLRMVCVFNPPVTGQEVHDENGVYPAATTDS